MGYLGRIPVATLTIPYKIVCVLLKWIRMLNMYTLIKHAKNTGSWLSHPSEKYESQLGWWHSHILWKIKNVWNHQHATYVGLSENRLPLNPWIVQHFQTSRFSQKPSCNQWISMASMDINRINGYKW
jgi:hypothetical protein